MNTKVILFTYNRSVHTKKVIDALRRNTLLPSELHIFQDGLKKEEHRKEWEKVNALIKNVDFCPTEIHVSEKNKGVAQSIVLGINQVFEDADAVIVLEDDCIPTANFMTYMMQCLEKYKENKKVYEIGGCSAPVALKKGQYDVYGCGRTCSWGWATWKDRWQKFSFDNGIVERLKTDKEKSRALAEWGSDCESMLMDNIAGKIDAWDIYWTLLLTEADGISVCPYESFIDCQGFDGSGVHCTITDRYKVDLIDETIQEFSLPDNIEISRDAIKAYVDLYGSYTALNEETQDKEKIIVYGLGRYFHTCEKRINQKYYIHAFIDENKNGWFAGKKILHLKNNMEYQNYKVLIMIKNVKECENVVNALISNGTRRNNIIVGYRMFGDTKALLNESRIKHEEWCKQQPIRNNKIVMLIGQYGNHAIQISRALVQRKNENWDIVWVADKYTTISAPKGIKMIQQTDRSTLLYEMTTAKVWIWDDISPLHIEKREGQIYIQVKHWSSITLKKFYLDDKKSPLLADKVIEDIIKDGARMDYLFSGSELDEISCRSGLAFQGKAIRIGSPRTDVLFAPDVRKGVLDYYNLPDNVKICLYVPTYRNKDLDRPESILVSLKMDDLLCALQKRWNGKWYLLVRVHPCLKMDWNQWRKYENIVNAEGYPDSEELVAAADVMITDYSSIMFEAGYIKRPVFLYAPDKKEFIEGERSLLIDYEALPFSVAETNEQLFGNIESFSEQKYVDRLNYFLKKYGVREDGHASERAAEFISKICR